MSIIYTAKSLTTGGRNGHGETDDGAIKVDLASPGAPNPKPGSTNPEQLFAVGYAACFGGALDFLARKDKLDVSDATVGAEVNLHKTDEGFHLSVIMHVSLSTLAKDEAVALIHATHGFCPYSKATRGNIDVTLKLNGEEI